MGPVSAKQPVASVRFEENPFSRRQRLWDRPEVERVLHALVDGRPSFVVVGDERYGKSGLLRLVADNVHHVGRRVLVHSFDAQAWAHSSCDRTLLEFWSAALAPLSNLKDPAVDQLLGSQRPSGEEVLALSRLLVRKRITYLLEVDNFDALLSGQRVSDLGGLLACLRRVAELAPQGICLLLASYHRIGELHRQTRHLSSGSPPFNVYDELVLGPLPDSATHELLRLGEPRLSEADRSFIRRAAGGHPEFLWRAAELLWRERGRLGCVQAIRLVAADLLVGASGAILDSTWQRWAPETKRLVLRLVFKNFDARASRGEAPRDTAQQLVELMCDAADGHTRLRRLLDAIDPGLRFELPGDSVPLRTLADEAVELLRRRGSLEAAWQTLRGAGRRRSSALTPATQDYLVRSGWLSRGPQGSLGFRVHLLLWWLVEGLAPVARGEIGFHCWVEQYQVELTSAQMTALDNSIQASQGWLAMGAEPLALGDAS